MKPTLVFDIEIYRNYFLLAFRNIETGNVRCFEAYPGKSLEVDSIRSIMKKYRLISFNGNNFDMPVLAVALSGAKVDAIKAVADKIIKNNMRYWQLDIKLPAADHIDLIEVAPGTASLKIYGGRLHCLRMQDLPIDPDADISPEDREQLRTYCVNDLLTTETLYRALEKQILLREQMGEQYDIDLRSKSDAQIAEAVIRHEVEKLSGKAIPKVGDLAGATFSYKAPAFIQFKSPLMQSVLNTVLAAKFTVLDTGSVRMPKQIEELKIAIGSSIYQMGIGGLHSTEKGQAHVSDASCILIDRDVASYYPAIILNCDLKPRQMGAHFTRVYSGIVQRRLHAKRTGDKVAADALKITINGSFGKFGSKYSALYSPSLLIQTTVTGQLSLLMLIEALESEGIAVVSANTDGVVIKCPRHLIDIMEYVVWEWESKTAFETEATEYKAIYSRDVNNYIAIKATGGYKCKGAYAPAALQKNPTNEIVSDAIAALLQHGTPVERTIRDSKDIRKFVTVRTVKGGAVKGESFLGKAIRWYYAAGETGTINYKLNGNKVPRSDGAKPLMELPDQMPNDINYQWYIDEARSVLKEIGYVEPNQRAVTTGDSNRDLCPDLVGV